MSLYFVYLFLGVEGGAKVRKSTVFQNRNILIKVSFKLFNTILNKVNPKRIDMIVLISFEKIFIF